MTRTTRLEKLMSRVAKPDGESGCWLWTSSLFPDGYGQLQTGSREGGDRKMHRAHRVSWEEHKGPIPDGALVLHRCDVRRCVNPAHLFLGTHDDNMRDCKQKGRNIRGRRCPAAKLDDGLVREIRRLCAEGERQRSVAQRYGVAQSLVSLVVNRKVWAHV